MDADHLFVYANDINWEKYKLFLFYSLFFILLFTRSIISNIALIYLFHFFIEENFKRYQIKGCLIDIERNTFHKKKIFNVYEVIFF